MLESISRSHLSALRTTLVLHSHILGGTPFPPALPRLPPTCVRGESSPSKANLEAVVDRNTIAVKFMPDHLENQHVFRAEKEMELVVAIY